MGQVEEFPLQCLQLLSSVVVLLGFPLGMLNLLQGVLVPVILVSSLWITLPPLLVGSSKSQSDLDSSVCDRFYRQFLIASVWIYLW